MPKQPVSPPVPSGASPGAGTRKRPAAVLSAPTRATGVSFEPVPFELLPGWAEDDHLAALRAFQASCPHVLRRKMRRSRRTGDADLVLACAAAMALPAKMTRASARSFFEAHFHPNRIVHARTEGLLTGYYEPVIQGSRTRQGRFQTPILKRPHDLVTLVPETHRSAPDGLTHARQTAAGLVPFPTRAEIEAGALAGRGLELLYLASPVDVYFLQVQGAGRVHLTDGTEVRVQYDGKNGHPYSSIGAHLIDKGLLAADKVSMKALGRWLKKDSNRASEVMNQNASFVFFREMPAGTNGPQGAFSVSLVPGRSLAIDPSFHRLGSLVFVSAPSLVPKGQSRAFNHLMVAHDVGGAIKGPERADIYFGSGARAESQASGVRHPGNLFVLSPIPASLAPARQAPSPARR